MKKIYKKLIIFLTAGLGFAVFFYFNHNNAEKIITEHVDIVISNAVVVTLNNKLEVYNPGYIVIKDTKILDLGAGDVPKQYIAQKTIDAQQTVVMPGLINTHSHSAMSLLNNFGQGKNLQDWLKVMQNYEPELNSDQAFWGSMLAQIKMLKSGTSTFNDMYMHPESTAKAANVLGMRAVVRIPLVNINNQISLDAKSLESEQNQLISFALAPNPLLNYSIEQLKQIANLALEKKLLVHVHFAEDAEFRKKLLYNLSLSPVELLKQSGLINNKIVLAHSAELTENEIKELAKYSNVGISFNPLSEYNLKTPLTPVVSMLNSGVLVGFGSDGEPSSNLSLFEQIKFAVNGNLNCLSNQQFCSNGKTLDAEKIIQMVTIDGAKILGLEEKIGSLEVGKQADLIFVYINDTKDIYNQLVYNINEGGVVHVIIAGKLIMENKQILTINESDIIQKAKLITETFK
jgi:5-methylthioadenosine/S-adenosylhomocysteine deaminase